LRKEIILNQENEITLEKASGYYTVIQSS